MNAAIVLCGGTSRRMGGIDKTAAALGATTVLDHLLDSLPRGWHVVCVGEQRPTTRTVTWTRESPPGGGPVAGMAPALVLLTAPGPPGSRPAASPPPPDHVVVVAGDMPFAGPAAADLAVQLRDAPDEVDAMLGSDGEGRTQPLLAAYRTMALVGTLPVDAAGMRLMGVVSQLTTRPVTLDARSVLDVDTPEALARARHMVEA